MTPPIYFTERRGRHHVVIEERLRWELAPVFDSVVTAREIALKATVRAPYFDNIPVCDYGSPSDCRKNARPLTREERGLG